MGSRKPSPIPGGPAENPPAEPVPTAADLPTTADPGGLMETSLNCPFHTALTGAADDGEAFVEGMARRGPGANMAAVRVDNWSRQVH